MKKLNPVNCAAILAGALLFAGASTNAQVNVTVDNNGNVTSSSPDGAFLSAGTVTANPFALSHNALVYDFSSTYPASSLVPVEGFVNIYADAAHTELVNVVAFEPDGPSYLVDMDLLSDGSKADVSSIPSAILADEASGDFPIQNLTEGMCGITTYIATGPNGPLEEPGFMDDAGGTITYTFDFGSGTYCAPDGGATFGLLGLSLFVIGAAGRFGCRKKNAVLS